MTGIYKLSEDIKWEFEDEEDDYVICTNKNTKNGDRVKCIKTCKNIIRNDDTLYSIEEYYKDDSYLYLKEIQEGYIGNVSYGNEIYFWFSDTRAGGYKYENFIKY